MGGLTSVEGIVKKVCLSGQISCFAVGRDRLHTTGLTSFICTLRCSRACYPTTTPKEKGMRRMTETTAARYRSASLAPAKSLHKARALEEGGNMQFAKASALSFAWCAARY